MYNWNKFPRYKSKQRCPGCYRDIKMKVLLAMLKIPIRMVLVHEPERAMAPHSSTLAWKIHGRRSLIGCSHGVAKSQTRLSNFTFTFYFNVLAKEMATHSSVLAWRILGTGTSGGLPSIGSHRIGHNWSDLAAAAVHERGYKKGYTAEPQAFLAQAKGF